MTVEHYFSTSRTTKEQLEKMVLLSQNRMIRSSVQVRVHLRQRRPFPHLSLLPLRIVPKVVVDVCSTTARTVL